MFSGFGIVDWAIRQGLCADTYMADNTDYPAGVVQAVLGGNPTCYSEGYHAGYTASLMSDEYEERLNAFFDKVCAILRRAKENESGS